MPTMTRPSVPLLSSTISSAMRRSVRSNARASRTVDCFGAAAMVRAIWAARVSNSSAWSAERLAQRRLAVLGRVDAAQRAVSIAPIEQPVHRRANDSVALAGRPTESVRVGDAYPPACRLDQPPPLEGRERFGDAGAPDAEHLRDEIVRELQRLATQPI